MNDSNPCSSLGVMNFQKWELFSGSSGIVFVVSYDLFMHKREKLHIKTCFLVNYWNTNCLFPEQKCSAFLWRRRYGYNFKRNYVSLLLLLFLHWLSFRAARASTKNFSPKCSMARRIVFGICPGTGHWWGSHSQKLYKQTLLRECEPLSKASYYW